MQKIKILLLLPALFIFPYIMSSMNESSDAFYSFSEPTTSRSLGTPLPITNLEAGTSSGSGDDDKTMKRERDGTQADVFLIPNSPTKKSEKPIIPKLTLTPREESNILKQQEKQEKISNAISPLETPPNTPSSANKNSKRRVLSPEPLHVSPQISPRKEFTKQSSHLTQKHQPVIKDNVPQLPLTPPNTPEKALTPKNGSAPISQHQLIETSPAISPRNVITKTDNISEAPSSFNDQQTILEAGETSSPIHTPSPTLTPLVSPRTATPEKQLVKELKTLEQPTNSHNTNINDTPEETNLTSMRSLTWKDGGTALLTIAGLLSLLYYLDKLPTSISVKIDNLLATFKMNG